MKSKRKASDDSNFFVEIDQSQVIRRYFLESTRDVIHCMQRLESFKELQLTKEQEIKNLRDYTDEITKSLNDLKKVLPHVSLREQDREGEKKVAEETAEEPASLDKKGKKVVKKKAVDKKNQAEPTKTEQVTSELESLEKELADIESKLKMI